MSEPAPERPATGGGGNPLTRKVGPLPLWAWLGIGLGLALAWRTISSAKSSSSGQNGSGTSISSVDANGQAGTDSSLIPQFVNQTYVQDTPPAAATLPSTINVDVGQQPVGTGSAGTNALGAFEGKSGGWKTQSIGGQNFGLWGSDGKYSLATIAKSHGTTPQQIISSTTNYGGNTAAFQKYVSAGNFNAKLPTGVAVAIPITGSGAANP